LYSRSSVALGSLPPYQPKADRTGYSQQQLDAQTWRVQFSGNINTPRETVENYLLYRSAEIMLFGGYDKFVMLEKHLLLGSPLPSQGLPRGQLFVP
jgi:hypothetical protein